jgi:divalent metal cation (Fe/Co/Zn/Cd) transporter
MAKMIIAFISLFLIFFFGIDIFRKMTGKEKISLTKWLGYSMLCTLLAVVAATLIVLLF